jgi:hypothetical protein
VRCDAVWDAGGHLWRDFFSTKFEEGKGWRGLGILLEKDWHLYLIR